ncbi:MAG: hypothetical protein KGM46_07850 [Pseudomonadota bacterium]|jgi:hypothetical protein|nr:hypothetical protein [Xanthomonadaceae bacterium]MDE2249001.1 hypothetical protein [Xanthomonadaceae bacterium]MDE3210639.1 hypothetical protein [Pseudomonadota bacterium]
MLIHGRCHCGNIAFEFRWEPDPEGIPARACTCSFCTKHGAAWTATPGGVLKIGVAEPADVAHHAFATRTAEFHVCTRCGVVPMVTSRIDGRLYAVVNVNTFEGLDSSLLRPSPVSLDDESEGERLARRKRSWIADVEFIETQA